MGGSPVFKNEKGVLRKERKLLERDKSLSEKHWPRYIDCWLGTPCSLARLVAGFSMLGGWSFRGRPISLSRILIKKRNVDFSHAATDNINESLNN
jgi:hypothetical protein